MTQAAYTMANAVVGTFLPDLNNHLAAIVDNNSGSPAPGTTFAGMFWFDSADTPWTLKVRSHDDASWASLFKSDGTIVAAPAAHTIASHSDTSGTGAQLNTLTDNSMADTLHRHSELSASDGTPDAALSVDAAGDIFILDANGLVVGHTAKVDFGATPEFQILGTATPDSSMGFARFENNASGPDFRFLKSRGATIGANVIVQNGDILGRIRFQAADGNDFNTPSVQIHAEVDGAPGLNDMPGRLIFSTTADGASSVTERMRIDSSGNVGIGVTPAERLHVKGATPIEWLDDTMAGLTSLSRTMAGLQISSGGMSTINKFTGALKFMSTDANLTTENPKLLGVIVGRATEDYIADTDGGMALDFFTTPDNPGTTSIPVLALTINNNSDLIAVSLAGTGSRTVVAAADGTLSAP